MKGDIIILFSLLLIQIQNYLNFKLDSFNDVWAYNVTNKLWIYKGGGIDLLSFSLHGDSPGTLFLFFLFLFYFFLFSFSSLLFFYSC